MEEIAEGLAYLHAQRVVHGDINDVSAQGSGVKRRSFSQESGQRLDLRCRTRSDSRLWSRHHEREYPGPDDGDLDTSGVPGLDVSAAYQCCRPQTGHIRRRLRLWLLKLSGDTIPPTQYEFGSYAFSS
jgi:hypothetical protein